MRLRICIIALIWLFLVGPPVHAEASTLDDLVDGLKSILHRISPSTTADRDRVDRWRMDIERVARRHGLDPCFLQALVACESAGDHRAVSHRGAIGLCQLMPPTAAELGVDPWDPLENLDGGARYIKMQLQRFGDVRRALWAYNAGPERVASGARVPVESIRYAGKVIREFRRLKEDTS